MSPPSIPTRASVVVVGGGFAGAATAYHLARAGVSDVLMLERESTCGYHASGRNAGLCRQLTDDDVVTDMAVRGAEFLREPPAGFAPAPVLKQTGSLLISNHPIRLDQLAARAALKRLPHERLDRDALLARWPRLSGLPCAGAVAFPTDGVIDIHALLQGFLTGARAGGTQVELSVDVRKFKHGREPMSVTIETSRGSVTTSCVVNAAGAWAGEVGKRAGATAVQFTSLLRHLFLTDRVPNLDAQAPFFWYVDKEEMYGRPEGHGFLLSACDAVETPPGDARVLSGAAAELTARLKRLTPWLAELGNTRSWACLRTFAADRRPVVGWDPKIGWLFWVAGLGGHGATTAAAIGQMAAADISHKLATLAPPA
jgi:D-arginine dehydrogenase